MTSEQALLQAYLANLLAAQETLMALEEWRDIDSRDVECASENLLYVIEALNALLPREATT